MAVALSFSNWTDEIAEVSELFQNAEVALFSPSALSASYSWSTGEWTYEGDQEYLYEDKARVTPIRWGVNHEGEDVSNASTITAVQVQLPKDAVGHIQRGVKMVVPSCNDNPALESVLFTLTSDLQGSNAASRTFEFSVDGDIAVPEVEEVPDAD